MSDLDEPRATRSRSRSLKRGERENGKNGHALTRSQNDSERVGTTERLTSGQAVNLSPDELTEETTRRIREQAAACLERRRARTAARAAFNAARKAAKSHLHNRRLTAQQKEIQ